MPGYPIAKYHASLLGSALCRDVVQGQPEDTLLSLGRGDPAGWPPWCPRIRCPKLGQLSHILLSA